MNTNRARITRFPHLSLALLLLAATAGCDSVFEVDNPNQLVQEDLQKPQSAAALVNGTESSVARALGQILLPLSVASDELTSIGSLDYGRQLDYGYLSNPANDITNSAFPFVAEARFMADESVEQLRAFDAQGQLRRRSDLARAYLYAGIIYTAVADAYDDFVVSNRRVASPPIGGASMIGLYDRAIGYLDEGLAVARATGSRDLELAVLAQRARARHARGVWEVLHGGGADGSPLVSDPALVADAEAALQLLPSPDWRLQFQYAAGTVGNQLGSQTNVRQEYRVSNAYAVPTPDGKRVAGIRLRDPVEGMPDAALEKAIAAFTAGAEYPALTVVSARELQLLLAEAALGRGDGEEAAERLNRLRDLDGRAPLGEAPSLLDLLRHERRVNLFLQGRRLADHYRFGEGDPAWQAGSDAVRAPGTFLPIAEIERLSNCHILGSCG